jgi:hypothetical protein
MTWLPPDPATLEQSATTQDPWRARQKRYFETHVKRCVICGCTDAVHAHHRHYRDQRGEERDKTIVALCAFHHRQVHRWHDKIAPRDALPYRWLSIVTTLAIWVLWCYRGMRDPWVVAASTVVVTLMLGVWVPIAVLVVAPIVGPGYRAVKKKT